MAEFGLQDSSNTSWLHEVLDEVGLQQFHFKLTNDLQLTKLSHFDFVSEEDLIQIGISKPASRRLLAAIKKRKSFVTTLKNKIVNKLTPSLGNPSGISSNKKKLSLTEDLIRSKYTSNKAQSDQINYSRLTCLINSQDVKIKEEIGHGAHGFVKKGEWTTPSGRVLEVAVKILRKDVVSDPGASFNDFVKEISVMHQLNHPNIIKLYGVVLSSPMMMVTELAPFGNLRDRLRSEAGRTSIAQLISFGVQISSGLAYLETKRFVHRDIAARNIFISHGEKILIGDLGLMRAIPNQVEHYTTNERTKIPYPWCAPESLRYKQFSSASDVYMFGVTLWEMFSFGKEPWLGLNMNEILENISSQKKRLPCPQACPAMVYQTLIQCWDTEPTCRPNFGTLYQYLSTSYPLEVRCTKAICEIGYSTPTCFNIDTSMGIAAYSATASNEDSNKDRNILNCVKDDRIFVIDGQPEKFWWKGQNQRSFEIGWFPLESTRWLTPKRDLHFVGNNIKNNISSAAQTQLRNNISHDKTRWIQAKENTIQQDDNASKRMNDLVNSNSFNFHSTSKLATSGKTKLKLSRLFGMHNVLSNDTVSSRAPLVPYSYQRLFGDNTKERASLTNNKFGISHRPPTNNSSSPLVRSQSEEFGQRKDPLGDNPPLIDFSDDATNSIGFTNLNLNEPQESILDLDNPAPFGLQSDEKSEQRPASETRLDGLYDDFDTSTMNPPRAGSCTGSWNTGTFYDFDDNIYSAYYCPQDAGTNQNVTSELTAANPPDRYYSAVPTNDTMEPF